ncbi:metal-sensing transcriptional repressor [Clostridium sp. UBA6640]
MSSKISKNSWVQIEVIIKIIEEERYCVDVLNQIVASQ